MANKRLVLEARDVTLFHAELQTYYRAAIAGDNPLMWEGLECAEERCQQAGIPTDMIERWKRDVDAEGIVTDDNP